VKIESETKASGRMDVTALVAMVLLYKVIDYVLPSISWVALFPPLAYVGYYAVKAINRWDRFDKELAQKEMDEKHYKATRDKYPDAIDVEYTVVRDKE